MSPRNNETQSTFARVIRSNDVSFKNKVNIYLSKDKQSRINLCNKHVDPNHAAKEPTE